MRPAGRFFLTRFPGENMSQAKLLDIIPCNNILGEGVQWNHQDQSVWWTDILSAKIFRYQPQTKNLREWKMPEPVGCFAFVENDPRLVVGFATGFAWFDLETGEHEWIARPELTLAGNRFNDGRVDRQGRFWIGGVVEQADVTEQGTGLYCLDQKQQVTQHLSDLKISNSLCWSPDSSRLYHADSPSFQIHCYDFDAVAGQLSNPRVFATLPEGVEPDGACVDTQGFVWNAQWGGSRVVRYSPAGDVDEILPLPVTQPTCVALGGPEMNWLFVTCAQKGLTEEQLQQQPHAGSLFIYEVNAYGLHEHRYIAD